MDEAEDAASEALRAIGEALTAYGSVRTELGFGRVLELRRSVSEGLRAELERFLAADARVSVEAMRVAIWRADLPMGEAAASLGISTVRLKSLLLGL